MIKQSAYYHVSQDHPMVKFVRKKWKRRNISITFCMQLKFLFLVVLALILYIDQFNYALSIVNRIKLIRNHTRPSDYELFCNDSYAQEWQHISEEKSETNTAIYYRRATATRNSSYPFISGDSFRSLSDHIFDENLDVSLWKKEAQSIQQNDIVFVQSTKENTRIFFRNDTFNSILNPFVLITHNSDESVPLQEHEWVIEDKRILAWFTQNPRLSHSKLFPVPIGLPNIRWPHGDLYCFKKAFRQFRKPFHDREIFLYVNMEMNTNRKLRSRALEWALGLPLVKWRKRSTLDQYLKDLGNSKFVLSPPGNGLDCHRTWESLFMGAVPILLRSHLDPLLRRENILIVNDWADLTYDYLNTLSFEQRPSRLLLVRYWLDRLKSINSTQYY